MPEQHPADHEARHAGPRLAAGSPQGQDRRRHRRHELASPASTSTTEGVTLRIAVDEHTETVGSVVDLSAGGIRVRVGDGSVQPGESFHVRLSLPPHAGIRPFVRLAGSEPQPSCDWEGRLEVARRIERADGSFELGGRLIDMTPVDRGMLGLYLSIHPLAA